MHACTRLRPCGRCEPLRSKPHEPIRQALALITARGGCCGVARYPKVDFFRGRFRSASWVSASRKYLHHFFVLWWFCFVPVTFEP